MKQRVVVIDDSPFIRRILTDWLKEEPDFEVVGTAVNGEAGAKLVAELKPDVVTLDVEMPVCDGISALARIMADSPTPVLMVSSVTVKGAEQTLKALEIGAIDFVTKPNGGSSIRFLETKSELISKLRGLRGAKMHTKPANGKQVTASVTGHTDKVVFVASSTGGPRALATFFSALPHGFPAPIVVVQHMPVGFTASLATRLSKLGSVPVREAKDGDRLEPGKGFIAPAGKHLVFTADQKVSLTDGASVHGVKPAADLMFSSAAKVFGSHCIGVVLTGMGRDGATGAADMRKAGGVVFGECESSCVVYGMPKAAKDAGGIDAEFAVEDLAQAVSASLAGRAKRVS